MSTNIFDLIKSHVTIEEVVSEYTSLTKAGNYWKSRCPFHVEKTASFTISPARSIFYCFGCHAGGDVIAFVARIEHCSQLEAAQLLAKRYNITLPQSALPTINPSEKDRYYLCCQLTATWCHKQLYKTPIALRYLKQRGIEKAHIDRFTIGYFPGSLQAINRYVAYMKDNNYLLEELLNAKIIQQGKMVLYSPFEERIIFPIQDSVGNFCGFGGRIFHEHDARPKYYNSHENNFFDKGSLLFGFHHAKKEIQATQSAFLVEGYFDCIAMVARGYTNTCATLGTACTINHLKTLSRFASQLFILYDSDEAGKQAIVRLAQLCWQADIELLVIELPLGHDPASYLKDHDTLQPYLAQACTIFDFFIERYAKDFSKRSIREKLNTVRTVLEPLSQVPDPLRRDMLIQKAAKSFDIPFRTLYKELLRIQGKRPVDTSSQSTQIDHYKLEKRIFSAILNNISHYTSSIAQYLEYALPEPYRELLAKLRPYATVIPFNFAQFFDSLTKEEQHIVSQCVVAHEAPNPTEFNQLMLQLHKKQWKLIVRAITKKLTQAKNSGNEEEMQEIMRSFLEFKEKNLSRILTENNLKEEKQ